MNWSKIGFGFGPVQYHFGPIKGQNISLMHRPPLQTWSKIISTSSKQFWCPKTFWTTSMTRHETWGNFSCCGCLWVFGSSICFSLYKSLSYWTKQVIDGTFERMFIIIARLHTNNYKHRNIHNNENFIGASGLLTLLFPIIAASSLWNGSAQSGSLAKASNKWILTGFMKVVCFLISDNLQYNTLCVWVDGSITLTKYLMFQVLFFS